MFTITFKAPSVEETTEPEVTQPEVTEPEITEPEATAPHASEPTPGAIYVGTVDEINNAVSNNDSGIIILTQNIDLGTATVTIPAEKSIILDLNGYTLTTKKSSGGTITVNGVLTIQDTSAEGDGLIQNPATSSDRGVVINGSNTTMTLKTG